MPILRIHEVGDWTQGLVRVRWVQSTMRVPPNVQMAIDQAWDRTLASRPGIKLFDGPMCRVESWRRDGATLELSLSTTSYKSFFGTNLSHAELADEYGKQVLASPLGLSSILLSTDDKLLMGRRNDSVAYYPKRVHPFAGCMEPNEPYDVFAEIRRELAEELSFTSADVAELRLVGLVEDLRLRQIEAIFVVRTSLSETQVRARLEDEEHVGMWSSRATPEATAASLGSGEAFTPVGVAALLLAGHRLFGDQWFMPQLAAVGALM